MVCVSKLLTSRWVIMVHMKNLCLGRLLSYEKLMLIVVRDNL